MSSQCCAVVKLAFHDADTDTDVDFLASKSRVPDVRMHRRVGRVGVVGVRVGVVECQLNSCE